MKTIIPKNEYFEIRGKKDEILTQKKYESYFARFYELRIYLIARFCNYVIEDLRIFNYAIFEDCKIMDYTKVNNIETCKLINCTFVKPVPMVCPEGGEFIGYKKCVYVYDDDEIYCIVKLLIPANAERSSAFRRKCRCSRAKVLGIYDLNGVELKNVDRAYSAMPRFLRLQVVYRKGEEVFPDDFDENRYNECSNGIHFFMTFEEAAAYDFK